MPSLLLALIVLVAALAYWQRRTRRARPAKHDAVAALTAAALSRLLARVGTVARAGEAVPASASIWAMSDGNLQIKEEISVDADGIVDAAVDHAASCARAQPGPPSEAQVTEWLQQGVCGAIGRFVGGRMDRMGKRLAIMTRTPPPSPAEIAELRRENERERAEMEKLTGAGDGSTLPTAIVHRA